MSALAGCTQPELPNALHGIKQRDSLRVGMQYAPGRYEIGTQGAEGIDYELIADFADFLGVSLSVLPFYDETTLRNALLSEQIDVIVHGETLTPLQDVKQKLGPRYLDTAWELNPQHDDALRGALFDYFNSVVRRDGITQLQQKYSGKISALPPADLDTFIAIADEQLMTIKTRFNGMSDDIDWQLLAALAYQSHGWQFDTNEPLASASFLSMLDNIPARVPQEERQWMALAAIYSGFPHLTDCRTLTETQGGNSDHWLDIKQRYPLLESKAYYRHSAYGYVNGSNTVQFVENIQQYRNALIALSNSY